MLVSYLYIPGMGFGIVRENCITKGIRIMAKKAAKKTAGAKKPLTRAQVITSVGETTGLTKKDVTGVMDAMSALIKKNIGKNGPGVININGLLKIMVQRKPATKARKGTNPFTGEATTFKAKPARNVVKIRPLKALKDMV